jgi:hypothetical protein
MTGMPSFLKNMILGEFSISFFERAMTVESTLLINWDCF